MLKKILIGLGIALALLWFLWWWSLGFPARIEVREEAAQHQGSYNFLIGSVWKFAGALNPYNGLIGALATVFIAIFTYVLWDATAILARAERDKRSLVGGGGQRALPHYPSIFQIEAWNGGNGSAILSRIRWGFGDLGLLPQVPQYTGDDQTREPLMAGKDRPVRHAPIPPNTWTQPVIFVRFDYTDVTQRRTASIGFVLIIQSPHFPPLPIHTVNVPPAYLADNFPLEV
jgi:hypothetical protein